jgi:hypothetical protein
MYNDCCDASPMPTRPPEVTFSYTEYDEYGSSTYITRTIRGDDSQYLPNLLQMFHYFLKGMTFSYVDTVVAYGPNGSEHTSEDANV